MWQITKTIMRALLLGYTPLILAQTQSDFIQVDQFGYLPNQNKVAVLSNPQTGYNSNLSYTPSSSLQICDAQTNAVVLRLNPTAWKNGQTHAQSGDQGWWLDFSALSTPGSYYVWDSIQSERSATFSIGTDVYAPIIRAAGRMFYYNRCNAPKPSQYAGAWSDGNNFNQPLQDFNCRYIFNPNDANLEKDLSGGWFDAGDNNKYVTFTHSTLHQMLSAYEENPAAFTDSWNIPESGNGIPDLLDEIKWELDWLLKMTNADGSVHIKMGNQNYSQNVNSPPSVNADPRFYGPTCSSASITVASVFAHAAKVFATIPSWQAYAQQLQQVAISTFNYSKPFVDNNNYELNCDNGEVVSGDADQPVDRQRSSYVTAAVYLWEQTGDTVYHQAILQEATLLEQLQIGFWGPYYVAVNDALILYTNLPNADANLVTAIDNSYTQAVSTNGSGFFGFSGEDLYRAFMPDWSYHWGSSNAKASYGVLNASAAASNVLSSQNTAFEQYVDECIHYFHGVNPQGMVYLSNMYPLGASRCVNEIYHFWFAHGTIYDHALNSTLGPPPGYVTGGPNASFSVGSLSPPTGQPAQKSYLDFNDGYPLNSWEISEPAIYYQAVYLRLLAHRVDTTTVVTGLPSVIKEDWNLQLYPNPSRDWVQINSSAAIQQISLYSLDGRQLWTGQQQVGISMANLPVGIYVLVVEAENGQVKQQLLFKQE